MYRFGLLLLLILPTSSSRSIDYSGMPQEVEPLEVIQEVEGYDFYFPVSIAADSGLVFIADYRDCLIRVFNEKLDSLYSIGRK